MARLAKWLRSAFCILVASTSLVLGAELLEQVTSQGTQLLMAGRSADRTIRQCSCPEQEKCVDEMKGQGVECFHSCWEHNDTTSMISHITDKPIELKECFRSKEYIIDEFAGCLKGDYKTCVAEKNGPQIPYTDINKVILAGEMKLHSQVDRFLKSLSSDGSQLLETALKVGTCIKSCFLAKNAGGYCFDREKCQPKIEVADAKRALKRCTKEVGWKKEAVELCQCATNAGVEKVRPYCQLLKTLERNRGARPNSR